MFSNLANLKQGKKYTIVGFSGAGDVYGKTFRLINIRHESFSQHPDAYLLLIFSVVRQTIRLHPNKQFIIWDGEVNPKCDLEVGSYLINHARGILAGAPTQKMLTQWKNYDPRYMYRALESVKEEPLITHILPRPVGRAVEIDLCMVG